MRIYLYETMSYVSQNVVAKPTQHARGTPFACLRDGRRSDKKRILFSGEICNTGVTSRKRPLYTHLNEIVVVVVVGNAAVGPLFATIVIVVEKILIVVFVVEVIVVVAGVVAVVAVVAALVGVVVVGLVCEVVLFMVDVVTVAVDRAVAAFVVGSVEVVVAPAIVAIITGVMPAVVSRSGHGNCIG